MLLSSCVYPTRSKPLHPPASIAAGQHPTNLGCHHQCQLCWVQEAGPVCPPTHLAEVAVSSCAREAVKMSFIKQCGLVKSTQIAALQYQANVTTVTPALNVSTHRKQNHPCPLPIGSTTCDCCSAHFVFVQLLETRHASPCRLHRGSAVRARCTEALDRCATSTGQKFEPKPQLRNLPLIVL